MGQRPVYQAVNCTMDPNNLTIKDIVLALSPTILLIIGIVFLAKGKTWFAAIILVPLIVFFIYSFIKMPWQEIGKKETERREKLLETKTGKLRYAFIKLSDFLSVIAIVSFLFVVLATIYLKAF
ncbi:MAG: hypothetical protein MK188_06115 [Gammaproteobacteria bacterium]|nr:hypothetical protein [Gammaproteobacteria bacterium]